MKLYAEVKEMLRLATVILATTCFSLVSVGLVDAAIWEFHDGLQAFPDNPDRVTVYGTVDCVIQEPPLYRGWIQYCETVSGCVPPWCNDYYLVFEWAPDDPGTCHNIDRWKVAAPGGWPHAWWLRPLGDYIDTYVPPEGLHLPSVGDATGIYRDIYIVVNLEEFSPALMLPDYWIENGECPDLPGYLIGTTPIEFTPWDYDPFHTTRFTGRLWLDGDIWFWPGGASATDETSWGSIKALFR